MNTPEKAFMKFGPKAPQDLKLLPRLKQFIEHAPVSIAMFDPEMRYIAASQRWMNDCNVSFQDVVGKCHYDVVPNIPERWRQGHQRALQGIAGHCEEDHFLRSDGRTEWLRWELQPWYKSDHEVGGIIMFVEHITKRKEAEQQVAQLVEQLNRSNQELKSFSAACSHDLKAPIRNLANFTQLLRTHCQNQKDSTTDYYWTVVEENILRMQEMVHSFLLYAELGAKGIQKDWIDLEKVVEAAKISLASEISEKNAKITFDPLPKVFVDASLMGQVFQNLLSNALKFNRSLIPCIHVKAEQKEKGWRLFVEDNGVGIETDYFDTVFENFSRLHSKTQYPGTGIGLALCKKIVEAHQGTIWVEKSSEKGTIFCFTVPDFRC